jgi:aminobenzoyl-glutamate transport protein
MRSVVVCVACGRRRAAGRRGLRRVAVPAGLRATGRPDGEGYARDAPFYRALIAGFMLLFLLCGWAYGSAAGTIASHRDVVRMMTDGLRDIAPFLVIAFFAAHFIAMFAWSNLGPIIAIEGANLVGGLELSAVAMLLPLLLVSSVFDLLIGSASAKWSAMAPVVVPMLMLLGISPEMTTAAYRVGDSIFNIVTPVATNFVLVLVMCQRWVARLRRRFADRDDAAVQPQLRPGRPDAGRGVGRLGLPVGPGAPATYLLPTPAGLRTESVARMRRLYAENHQCMTTPHKIAGGHRGFLV